MKTIRVKMVRHVHKKGHSIRVPAVLAGLASFVTLKWFLARMQHSEKVTYRILLGANLYDNFTMTCVYYRNY